jgi:hypothetical protein
MSPGLNLSIPLPLEQNVLNWYNYIAILIIKIL